jgi:hypothetical protein
MHYAGIEFFEEVSLYYPIAYHRPNPTAYRTTPSLLLPYQPKTNMSIGTITKQGKSNYDKEDIQQTNH